jgi:predicted nucleic-acid-binding protein
MIGIDTNVLLRMYVDDVSAPVQVAAARAMIAARGGEGLWISLPVVLEATWLLQRYGQGRSLVVRFLVDLLDRAAFVVQERGAIEATLERYCARRIGYADCLIEALAEQNDVKVTYTFDRAAADHDHFALVETGA